MALLRPAAEPPPAPLSRYWKAYVTDCTEQVTRFHRITAVVGATQVRTWLGEIGKRLDAELEAVHRLAAVGDSIEPARFRITEPPAKRIASRLSKAKVSLKQSVDQAAEIAEQAVLDPTHDDVRVHLDVLNEQVGRLAIAAPLAEEPEPGPRRRRWRRPAS
ncbi:MULTISPECIES: hypothetical protein [Pseudonocardia]|uniref:Uncharacterized protein n=2 Tax=Pseudonocardia TaxID=1847 RepID=A0A1Y2MU03_PSEAH|nr:MULTISPECIES: hypothetical protein [Pseudonocardia]OSY38469.1 hypothetical protein BG845_03985 [Pseudonocardia autotrophica]TDN77088.1 hypothetical protein C8E95_6312 [Pseudonocardia autotrophica]BBG01094.1 hypothetical protein Pdca_23030 [Pseudonocardia autotrophica]GEC28787.1 hypothetical protein PSA01_58160 [Pseudonocardia saturnea]